MASLSPEELSNLSVDVKKWMDSGSFMEPLDNGLSIFYRDVGKKDGPVILLLHGHPSSCHDWEGVCQHLASKARLISFDHVGYGLSSKPEAWSYSLFQHADMTEGIMKKLGITEAHVVSHDISTSIHDELLARYQEGNLCFKILSNTFFNGSMLQWVSTEPDDQNKFQSNSTIFEGLKELPAFLDKYPTLLKTLCCKKVPSDSVVEIKRELMGFRNGHLRLGSQSVYMRERYIHADRWIGAMEKADKIRIAWASDDPIANIACGRELQQRVPQAGYFEWPGVGHFPNFEDPETVSNQILLGTGL